MSKNKRLFQDFFKGDALVVAPKLLGKTLVRKIGTDHIRCKIVEVEAYMGACDKGSHTYQNKRTKRTESMFLAGGHAYVYLIYGMHHCLNTVTSIKDTPQGVLIRAVEPMDQKSIELIRKNRIIKSNKIEDLTNGPGKLCQALAIDKSFDKYDLTSGKDLYIEDNNDKFPIKSSPRINIPYAEEYIDVPWRFHIANNSFVSII